MGFPDARCQAGELWRHLVGSSMQHQSEQQKCYRRALETMLDNGPLARRITRAVGPEYSRQRLVEVYGKLCECLETGNMFLGID